MTNTFRPVPYHPNPNAEPYHRAQGYAQMKGAKDPAKFAWWYVDNNYADKLSVPEAWKGAPDWMKSG